MKKIFTFFLFVLAYISASAYQITFRVDMTNQTVSGNGVHIAGNFQDPDYGGAIENPAYVNWDPSAIALTDGNADNIYEVTLDIAGGFTYQYKFVNGNAWGSDETIVGDCNIGGNRETFVSSADMLLPVVCYGECSFCASNPQFHEVTFLVDMQGESVSPNGVHLAGSFHYTPAPHTLAEWDPSAILMTDANADDVYEVTLTLAEGYQYQYKFVNGNAWGSDESVPGGCADGGNNRFYNVGTSSSSTAEVCFGSCADCIPAAGNYDVTFQVNMQNQVVSANGIHLAGSFGADGYDQWNPAGIVMTDANTDGIYEVTLTLTEGVYYEYKFVNGNDWPFAETPSGCVNGGGNRFFTLGAANETLDLVCYNECVDCTEFFNVTFRVDMNNVTDGFTTPEVNGIFNGWCGGCAPMTDADLDGVWELVIALPAGSYEYKFAADGWNIQEALTPGSSCTLTTGAFTNRVITVDNDVVLDPVCWNSCLACSAVLPEYDVTFRVNMNGVADPFTTPEVNGIFNGWCGGCAPMSDSDGDGIWEIVITLQQGTYEYKFAADSWNIQESLAQFASCTVNGPPFVNRWILVDSDIVLDPVCWGSCDVASLMFYADNDGDGFGAGAGSLFCVAPASGYSANNTDCNDNNANIYPGATEVCGNATDDDCDGLVNEGCSAVINDNFASATSVNAASFPFCSNRTVNLTGATASPEASTSAPVGAGQDVWYQFVASSQGARITSTSVACDVVIELQDAAHNVMFVENETTTGQEILAANNLTPGVTYYVLIRNFNPSSVGNVTSCIQNLASSQPNNGTSFNNLCSFIKCQWNGANLYSVTFDDGVNQYSASSTSTQIPFSLLPGIQYGTTYDVTFTSTFIQNDAVGNPTTTVVTSAPYTVTIEEHLAVALRATDRCPQTRSLGSFIGTDRVLCGVIGYEWEFTLADEFGSPIAIEPVFVTTNGVSRYVRVSSIAGVQGGDYYNVRVRPVFSSGPGNFGATQMLCVAGSAGMVENNPVMDMSTPNTGDALEVAIYPNPTAGEFVNVRISNITSETIQVKVLDAVGRVVMNNQYSVSGSLNSAIVFDRTLASGLYTLEVIDGNAVVTEKMIVE